MLETLDEATAASYEQAGWQRCYHQGNRGGIHINVKIHTDYRALHTMVETLKEKLDVPDDEIWRVMDTVGQRELDRWWEDLEDNNIDYLLSEDILKTDLSRKDYWSDGRMGGWLHVSENWVLRNPEYVPLLAEYCQESVKYFNGIDYVRDLEFLVADELEMDADAGKERCHTCHKIK